MLGRFIFLVPAAARYMCPVSAIFTIASGQQRDAAGDDRFPKPHYPQLHFRTSVKSPEKFSPYLG